MTAARAAPVAAGTALATLAAAAIDRWGWSGEETATGVGLLAHHLWQWAATLLLLGLCLALGRVALGRAGLDDPERPLATALESLALGAGLVAVATLAVGAVAGVSAWTLGATLLGSAALAAAGARRTGGILARAWGELRDDAEPWAGALFAVVAAFLVLLATTPPTDWDALMYHLDVPAEFLAAGRFLVPPDNLHVALVGLPHMLDLHLLAFAGAEAPAMASAAFGIALGLAAFATAKRWFGPLAGSFAVPLLYGTTMIPLVAITARIDVTLLLWLLVGHAALLEALDAGDRRSLALAGVVLGLAFGIKYHAGVYGAILGAGLVIDRLARRETVRRTAVDAAVLAGAAAVAALPWLAKNAILLGAPLHPFGADATMTPWLVDLYARAGVAAAPTVEAARALLDVRGGLDVVDLFLHPGRLTVEGEGSFYWVAPLLALVPLWALEPRSRRLAWILGPGVAFLAIVSVLFPVTNPRYLLPAIPALSIGVAAVLAPRARSSLLALLAALNLVPSGIAMHRWVTARQASGHAAGLVSAAAFRASHPDPGIGLLDEAAAAVEARTAGGGPTLLLFEARGFAFDAPVLQDVLLANWSRLAPLVAGTCAPVEGDPPPFTHVLLNEGVLGYYFDRGLDPATVEFDAFRAFADRCLDVVWTTRGYALFEWRDAVPGR